MNDKPTKERLADALVEAGLTTLAARALGGAYDDFESDSVFPLMDLVNDIRDAGGPAALIQRVQDGDFDGTDAEASAWFHAEGQFLLKPKDDAP